MVMMIDLVLAASVMCLGFSLALTLVSQRMRRAAHSTVAASKAMLHACAWYVTDNERLRGIILAHGINPGPGEAMARDMVAMLETEVKRGGLH